MISVITICRNAGKDIRSTIESVLGQTSNDFEYIIKDGQSTDNTLEIANQYVNKFSEKDVRYHVVTKSDSGIYSAMNQAAGECCGDWVIYMNAGDTFHDETVIERLSAMLSKVNDNILAVIGRTNYVLHCGLHYVGTPRANAVDDLDFCHQSVLVRSEYLMNHLFDEQYKIVADRDQLLEILQNSGPKAIHISEVIVSNYNTRGASQTDFSSTEAEAELLYQKYNISHRVKNTTVAKLKNVVAKVLPVLPDLVLVLKKSLK